MVLQALTRVWRARGYFLLGGVLEQFVGPTHQCGTARGVAVARRVAGDKPAATMLAHDTLPQVLHANLQPPPAGRTLLNEVDQVRHVGTSCNQAGVRLTQTSYDNCRPRSTTLQGDGSPPIASPSEARCKKRENGKWGKRRNEQSQNWLRPYSFHFFFPIFPLFPFPSLQIRSLHSAEVLPTQREHALRTRSG